LSPPFFINLLRSYINEDAFIVWQGLADVLIGLNTVTQNDDSLNANLVKFASKLVIKLKDKVGWEKQANDGHLTVLLRSIMIGLLAKFCWDDDDVVNQAKNRFAKFQEDSSDTQSLPSDMRASTFKILLKNGGDKEWNEVKDYFFKASDQAEKSFVLRTLGTSNDPKLKQKTLKWALSGEVKLQDFSSLLGSVGQSGRNGTEISWQFFQDNFDRIKGMIGNASPSLMQACIVNCAGGFCSEVKADEIDAFFKAHPLPLSASKIAQLIEGTKTNSKFLDKLKSSDLTSDTFWLDA